MYLLLNNLSSTFISVTLRVYLTTYALNYSRGQFVVTVSAECTGIKIEEIHSSITFRRIERCNV